MYIPETSVAGDASRPGDESVRSPVVPMKSPTVPTRSRRQRRNASNPFDEQSADGTETACTTTDAACAFPDIYLGRERKGECKIATKFPDVDMSGPLKGGFFPEIEKDRTTRTAEDAREVEFPDIDSERGTKEKGDIREIAFPTLF
jgi:hypothetical protein